MKTILTLGLLGSAGYFGWQAGGSMDSDALGMAVGIVLGVLAAIPTALILLASQRRREADDSSHQARPARRGGYSAGDYGGGNHAYPLHGHSGHSYAPQPPVIVLAGNGAQGNAQLNGYGSQAHPMQEWGTPRQERRFKLVGEQEAWIDEW